MPNTLYCGDNLEILRQHVAAESVDLVYLDPPFNSNASYNVLFRELTANGTVTLWLGVTVPYSTSPQR